MRSPPSRGRASAPNLRTTPMSGTFDRVAEVQCLRSLRLRRRTSDTRTPHSRLGGLPMPRGTLRRAGHTRLTSHLRTRPSPPAIARRRRSRRSDLPSRTRCTTSPRRSTLSTRSAKTIRSGSRRRQAMSKAGRMERTAAVVRRIERFRRPSRPCGGWTPPKASTSLRIGTPSVSSTRIYIPTRPTRQSQPRKTRE